MKKDKRRWIHLASVPNGPYSGQVWEELYKRHNKDGTVTMRVRPLAYVSVTSGQA